MGSAPLVLPPYGLHGGWRVRGTNFNQSIWLLYLHHHWRQSKKNKEQDRNDNYYDRWFVIQGVDDDKYKIIRAKTRRTIKCAKRRSWQSFVSKINSRTSIKKVWAMVRKLAGKYHSGDIPHLEVNNNKITDIQDISNELAHTFSNNSSSHNYNAIRETASSTWGPRHAAGEYEVYWRRHDRGIEHVQKWLSLQQQQPQQLLLLSAFV